MRLAGLGLLLAVVAHPSRASACSCGEWSTASASVCAASKREFAGTVADYRLHGLLASRWSPIQVELMVDRVWKGDVPLRVSTSTGHGGGDCGIQPPPGTRFIVCDDRAGDAAPDFYFCSYPAFDNAELEAALGSGDTLPTVPVLAARWLPLLLLPVLLGRLVLRGSPRRRA